MNIIGDITKVRAGLEILNYDIPNNKTVEVFHLDKGFSLSVSENTAKIGFAEPNDFFRAMSFVTDAFKKGENSEMSQTPAFKSCGIMLDASRDAVPKFETVKGIIKRMARMGMNELLMYTEDTYEITEQPYFGYMRGRYSKDEIKEIVSYAEKLGIEAVPCIQTLGHLAKPLRWSVYGATRDTSDILLAGEESTYELIEQMIKSCRECYKTDKIHIGMDEAHSVGLGAYLEKHGYQDRFSILSEHLKRVNEIVKKYGFKPMMWSDMFFRLASKTGDYYDTSARLPDNIKELIPEGVSEVYWDYYNHFDDVYDTIFKEHLKMGAPIVFAGGIWTWAVPAVNYVQALAHAVPALNACRKFGIENVFTCMWGDDGSECDMSEALYGMGVYAEGNYTGNFDEANLKESFRICQGLDADFFLSLNTDDFGNKYTRLESYSFAETEQQIPTVTKQALYQNPLLGLFDKTLEPLPLKEHYQKLYNNFKKQKPDKEFFELYDWHLQLLKVMCDKADIGIRLKKAYDEKDKNALWEISKTLKKLQKEVVCLKEKREILWYKNNKPFGFETVSTRLMSISELCERAHKRVEFYLSGKLDCIEELEQTRLPYNPDRGEFVHMAYAPLIMMP
ncbi:MAG: family 20 glycosylhydrolase [Clostridia bacterium]|nr:family 20 glycosylhydrolase [Clostridia bacterium]